MNYIIKTTALLVTFIGIGATMVYAYMNALIPCIVMAIASEVAFAVYIIHDKNYIDKQSKTEYTRNRNKNTGKRKQYGQNW